MTKIVGLYFISAALLHFPARAMECSEVLMYASNYQAAMVNCIACNTTSNNLSFADANSLCPGVAATWCMKSDPSCSRSGSGCTSAVIACEPTKPKPSPSPSPNPNPSPSSKPSGTTPVANQTQPTAIDEEDAYTIGSSQPNTQTPQQGVAQAQASQRGPNGSSQPGTSAAGGSLRSAYKSANTLPPTQLPGVPTAQPTKRLQVGQSGLLADGKDSQPIRGQKPRAVERDEFDNPIRSASPNPKIKTIPNNSGGQIPTSEASAQLPSKPQKPPAQSPYRKLGDLNTVSTSSGGGAPGTVQSVPFDDAPIESGNRRPTSTRPAEFQTVNLNSYLPGGANDRRRRLLMGEVLSSGEIHNRTVDLFRRITIRMSEFCANGELFDCR